MRQPLAPDIVGRVGGERERFCRGEFGEGLREVLGGGGRERGGAAEVLAAAEETRRGDRNFNRVFGDGGL